MHRPPTLLALVLLPLCAVAACGERKSEPSASPPSGGLAGSPPVGLASPPPPGADAAPPPTTIGLPGLGLPGLPPPDAAVALPPPPPDVAPPPPPPVESPPVPDAVVALPPPPPPDGGTTAGAGRRDAARADAGAEAGARAEVVQDTAGRADATTDTLRRPDAAPETAPRPDAAPEVMPSDDGGRPADAAPEPGTAAAAGTAGPPAADATRTFAAQQRNIQRCAEAEGPGELRVRLRVRGSDGRVREATVDSAYTDAAEQCARNLMATLRFPTFAGESATLEHTYVIAEMSTAVDVGPGATLEQQMEAEEGRLRRLAKRCIVGVEGAVTVHVWISAESRTATVRRVDGAVTPEQRECLDGVARSANLPNVPASTERSWRIQ